MNRLEYAEHAFLAEKKYRNETSRLQRLLRKSGWLITVDEAGCASFENAARILAEIKRFGHNPIPENFGALEIRITDRTCITPSAVSIDYRVPSDTLRTFLNSLYDTYLARCTVWMDIERCEAHLKKLHWHIVGSKRVFDPETPILYRNILKRHVEEIERLNLRLPKNHVKIELTLPERYEVGIGLVQVPWNAYARDIHAYLLSSRDTHDSHS